MDAEMSIAVLSVTIMKHLSQASSVRKADLFSSHSRGARTQCWHWLSSGEAFIADDITVATEVGVIMRA